MRSFVLPLVFLLAGCAHPVSQSASPTPMAAGCPMMHAGASHDMAGMAMTPSDTGAAHKCPCPMHGQMPAMSHDMMMPAHTGADSTHAMAGCPMCASGHCPMHAATPPDSGTHTH